MYICKTNNDPLDSLCGNYLGQLTDELTPGYYMHSFVTTGPKSYAYEQLSIDSTISKKKQVVKCKGLFMNSDFEKKLNVQELHTRVECHLRKKAIEPLTLYFDQIKRVKTHQIYSEPTAKRFKVTMDKRVILPDGGTIPYGYR